MIKIKVDRQYCIALESNNVIDFFNELGRLLPDNLEEAEENYPILSEIYSELELAIEE